MKIKITNSSVEQSCVIYKRIKKEIYAMDLPEDEKNGIYYWFLTEAVEEFQTILLRSEHNTISRFVAPKLMFNEEFCEEFSFADTHTAEDEFYDDIDYKAIYGYGDDPDSKK